MSALGSFNTQLIRFFQELKDTYPEERDIRMALEAIEGAKKINPKLILDLFYEHVYEKLHEAISREDEVFVIEYAKAKIAGEFNEMSAALIIFDKHWPEMSEQNQKAIWNYLKVLCVLCEKARAARIQF
jgi:ferritin-like metal-binding protein YciE